MHPTTCSHRTPHAQVITPQYRHLKTPNRTTAFPTHSVLRTGGWGEGRSRRLGPCGRCTREFRYVKQVVRLCQRHEDTHTHAHRTYANARAAVLPLPLLLPATYNKVRRAGLAICCGMREHYAACTCGTVTRRRMCMLVCVCGVSVRVYSWFRRCRRRCRQHTHTHIHSRG